MGDGRIDRIGGVRFRFLPHHQVFFFGLYEPATVAFFRRWLREGDCVLDVGANVGYLAAVALDAVGSTGRVFAFEPEPQHFADLTWLARENPDRSLQLHQAAVGSADGEIELFVSAHRGWHSTISGFNVGQSPQVGSVTVPQLTLDTVARTNGLLRRGAIRLIKVDVEGAELAVIEGARALLEARAADAFQIEVTPPGPNYPVPSVSDLFARLRDAGYAAFRLDSFPDAPTPVAPEELQAQLDVLFVAQ